MSKCIYLYIYITEHLVQYCMFIFSKCSVYNSDQPVSVFSRLGKSHRHSTLTCWVVGSNVSAFNVYYFWTNCFDDANKYLELV